MMKLGICVCGAFLMTSLGACGGEGGDGDGDGDGDNTSTGGETGDGDGSGGSGDGDTNGGDDHCSPGDRLSSALAYASRIANCPDGERSIVLPEPIGPGDTYSFSADFGLGSEHNTMELWGTTEACGEPQEMLVSASMGPGVVCMEASPQSGTYSHLIWVWTTPTASHDDVTFCPMGTCGQ